jgi:hypothetical protein
LEGVWDMKMHPTFIVGKNLFSCIKNFESLLNANINRSKIKEQSLEGKSRICEMQMVKFSGGNSLPCGYAST